MHDKLKKAMEEIKKILVETYEPFVTNGPEI
jgi:hypothetical protein